MIQIHWSWILFSVILIAIIGRLWHKLNQHQQDYPQQDYRYDLEPLLLTIGLIAFLLIWGGIFWW